MTGNMNMRALPAVGFSFAATAVLLAACGSGSSNDSSVPPAARSMHGTVYGGRQPVAGSTVTVYSAGLPGTGLQHSTQIGQTTSDAKGNWNVATLSPAPVTGQLVYVVGHRRRCRRRQQQRHRIDDAGRCHAQFSRHAQRRRADHGRGTSVLQHQMTLPLPYCSAIQGNTLASGRCVEIANLPTGTATDNSLNRRAGTFTNLVDPASGQAATFLTAAASGSPLNLSLQKLDTLADLLANCVNSAGGSAGDNSACGNLLLYTFDSSSTLEAAVTMASSPPVNTNGRGLLALLKPPLVYSPIVSSAPASWTVGGQPFAYVLNGSTHSLSGFSIDPASGALTPVSGSPFSGVGSTVPAASPNGRFVYTGAPNGTAVAAFAVDPATGALSPVRGSPFATVAGGSPTQVAVDPNGKFAYALVGFDTQSYSLLAYRIDADSGALTQVGGPYPAGAEFALLTVSPDGKFVYVANGHDSNIMAFGIDPAGGALSSLGAAIPAGIGQNGFGFSLDGVYLYASNYGAGNGSVSAYAFNASTGALTPVTTGGAASCGDAAYPGSPVDPGNCFSTHTPGSGAHQVAVDGSGQYLYTGTDSNSVAGFRIDPGTGALSLLPASPFTSGNFPYGVSTDSSGRFLYALNLFDNTISAYAIDAASGALTPISGSPYAAGGVGPSQMTVGP